MSSKSSFQKRFDTCFMWSFELSHGRSDALSFDLSDAKSDALSFDRSFRLSYEVSS
jgi:hypothetical protein